MSKKSISDALDDILKSHNVYFWKQEGKTVRLSDKELRSKFKQAILNLIADEYVQLLDSQIIKPEYHNGIVTKIKELRGEYGKT